jgi:hypothetical protein
MKNDSRKPPMSGAERSRRWRERKRLRVGKPQAPPSPRVAPPETSDFDPIRTLQAIAADPDAPAAARVAACRTLLHQEGPGSADPQGKVDELALRFLRSIN